MTAICGLSYDKGGEKKRDKRFEDQDEVNNFAGDNVAEILFVVKVAFNHIQQLYAPRESYFQHIVFLVDGLHGFLKEPDYKNIW